MPVRDFLTASASSVVSSLNLTPWRSLISALRPSCEMVGGLAANCGTTFSFWSMSY